jgi:hypothetical protein
VIVSYLFSTWKFYVFFCLVHNIKDSCMQILCQASWSKQYNHTMPPQRWKNRHPTVAMYCSGYSCVILVASVELGWGNFMTRYIELNTRRGYCHHHYRLYWISRVEGNEWEVCGGLVYRSEGSPEPSLARPPAKKLFMFAMDEFIQVARGWIQAHPSQQGG